MKKEKKRVQQHSVEEESRVKTQDLVLSSVNKLSRVFLFFLKEKNLILIFGFEGRQDPSLPQLLKVRLTLARGAMGEEILLEVRTDP